MSAASSKDCEVCLSAGSVNKWGICEICGEEFVQTVSMVDWRKISIKPALEKDKQIIIEDDEAAASMTTAGQDAA